MTALVLNGVCKHFGGVEAVSSVSFEVPPGKITGLIGPNGAGKTTIVNLITGMMPLTGGGIRLGGVDITDATPQFIARAGVARTFQTIRLLKDASVLDNVMIGFERTRSASLIADLFDLAAARRERQLWFRGARALLARFNMDAYADHLAGNLSYGHQRRVEMMRALAARPSLVLLDEPAAGMNDVEADALGGIFRELVDQGLGVLLIEHNMRFVMSLCDRVHVLESGRLIASGTPAAIGSDPRVIRAYLGQA